MKNPLIIATCIVVMICALVVSFATLTRDVVDVPKVQRFICINPETAKPAIDINVMSMQWSANGSARMVDESGTELRWTGLDKMPCALTDTVAEVQARLEAKKPKLPPVSTNPPKAEVAPAAPPADTRKDEPLPARPK